MSQGPSTVIKLAESKERLAGMRKMVRKGVNFNFIPPLLTLKGAGGGLEGDFCFLRARGFEGGGNT